jgi:hypothetical protein
MFAAFLDGEDELLRAQRQFAQGVWRATRAAVTSAGEAGIAEARRGAFQDHTRRLRDGLVFVLTREADIEVEGEMRSPVEYSSFVEEGTAAHVIRPKMGAGVEGPLLPGQGRRSRGRERQVLAFKMGGGTVFAAKVNHPGSRSIPFMGRAYTVAERALPASLEVELAKLAERFE